MTRMMASMKQLPARTSQAAWIAATLLLGAVLAASPVAAQVVTSNGQLQVGTPIGQQQLFNQSGASASSQAPTTGTFCLEEMTATFCNVPTSPNTSGYGSTGGGSSAASGSAAGSSAGVNTSSIPPCMSEPPADELCN